MSSPGKSLAIVDRFAASVGVDPQMFVQTIKATVLKTKDRPATDEEMVAFLAIAEKYGLNPWTKEIHAFVDTKSGGIVPIVGIDGWNHIANDHEHFRGEVLEMAPREEWLRIDDDAKLAPPWMKLTVYRDDRDYPTEHTEYLDECYVEARKASSGYKIKSHWQTHTKRALEHKTRIQGRRIAFGFSGIYDEDEAQRIIAAQAYDIGATQSDAGCGEVIGPEDHAAMLAEMARTGLSEDAIRKNVQAKAGYSGPLEDMPVHVYTALMAGLAKMATWAAKSAAQIPAPATETALSGDCAPDADTDAVTAPLDASDVIPFGDAPADDDAAGLFAAVVEEEAPQEAAAKLDALTLRKLRVAIERAGMYEAEAASRFNVGDLADIPRSAALAYIAELATKA